MCLLPDLHARQAVAISYTLSQHLLQHRLHSGLLVTLLLWSHFSRGHTFVFVWHWYGWLITRLGCMWVQNPSCTLAPPCVHTGCCEINATMRKRHCTHTTRNKQKTIGTLQLCTHVVLCMAAMHRFTVALTCCTTFLAFQNLMFPPTLLHPNSHSPMPLQPKLCSCKEPSSYLLCSLVSAHHSEVCPSTGLSWAVCACDTPWGPCLPSMSACSPRTQLLPTPYPSCHGPSSASKQALGSPAPGTRLQPLLNCCCLCSVLQCWLTSYQHCPKVATPRTGRLNSHTTLQSKHGYCQQEK